MSKKRSINVRNNLAEFNQKILDNAPMSIITIDKKGRIASANKYYYNFSRHKEYKHQNIFTNEFFLRENLTADYVRLLNEGKIFERDNCYVKNNRGEDKYLKIIAVPIRDQKGKIEYALSMAADVTEAVLFKNKLQNLNANLEKIIKERTQDLDTALKQLAKVLESKSIFMSDLSHEWRTSLAIIQGNLELLNHDIVFKSEHKKMFNQLFKEIRRMSIMLEDLTILTHSDAAGEKLNLKKFNLNRVIAYVAKSLKDKASVKNITIRHKNPLIAVEITADKNKLEKLFLNLIGNAIKYNRQNGWINIWLESADEEVIVKIEDNGIGIKEEHVEHIFERFYCVNRNKSIAESGLGLGSGSGLGLAICKSVLRAHGGDIAVDSRFGKGSIFIVRLPRNIEGLA